MAADPFHQLHVYRSNANNDRQMTDCYRLLYNKALWQYAADLAGLTIEQTETMIVESIQELRLSTFRFDTGNMSSVKSRLMQETIYLILAAIYANLTNPRDPGDERKAKQALKQIDNHFCNATWFIHGSVDVRYVKVETILRLLARKIKDHRFLKLVRHMLKTMYRNKPKSRNAVYPNIPNKFTKLFAAICLQHVGKQLEHVKVGRQVNYVCYKHHFVAGIDGSKRQAVRLRTCLNDILTNHLQLELLENKLRVTHMKKPIRFLGYNINASYCRSTHRRKIQFAIPENDLQKIARVWQYGDFSLFQSGRRTGIINKSEYEILQQYNKELIGLARKYCLADNAAYLFQLRYLALGSFRKTIAAKRKSTVKKVAKDIAKYGIQNGKKVRGKKDMACFVTNEQLTALMKKERQNLLKT
ncbi:hypothetical protein P5G51_008585 [Virgibacillus sp. 179-BFC.A HS]|uniref:Uncharacterized protein n=1 Tax=Tigheibacillus jepli TaxID=3035914 RepID=A0ABU5CHY4_9BACI|nr:hypothetical protein [Virgibacillus sp. 179-BFC.A HS]MDY0405447.1 hypothetical protein [Virgibacillus sp. 179-BFC.A HS]